MTNKTPAEIAADLNARYPISATLISAEGEVLHNQITARVEGSVTLYILGEHVLLGTTPEQAEAAILALPPITTTEAARRLQRDKSCIKQSITNGRLKPCTPPPYLIKLQELERYVRERRRGNPNAIKGVPQPHLRGRKRPDVTARNLAAARDENKRFIKVEKGE